MWNDKGKFPIMGNLSIIQHQLQNSLIFRELTAKCCHNPERDGKILLQRGCVIGYLKGWFKLLDTTREQFLSSHQHPLALNCARGCCGSISQPFIKKGKRKLSTWIGKSLFVMQNKSCMGPLAKRTSLETFGTNKLICSLIYYRV